MNALSGAPPFASLAAACFARPAAMRVAIGPLSIDIHAAGDDMLAAAAEALAHARSPTRRRHHLRVALMETRAVGLPPPPALPGTAHLRSPDDEVNLREDGRITAIHQAQSRTWEWFDAARGEGLLMTEAAQAIAPWEWASPLKRFIAWGCAGRDHGPLHGAVLGRDGEGVLLAGGSGCGKSTTTAAALLHGLSSAGDDVTLIEQDETAVTAHAAFDSLKLGAASLALLEGAVAARGLAVGPGTPKHMLRLTEAAPRGLAPSLRLRAILLPRLAGGARSAIRPASGAEAFRALGPVSAFVMRVTPEDCVARAARLSRALPAFTLDLSRDPMEAAAAIDGFIAGEGWR